MAIQVTNTSSQLSGKTIIDAEDNQTITGVKTFDLDPSAPFVVTASSAVVTNLDADKVDGKEAADLLLLDGTQAMTGKLDLGTNGQIQFPASQNASADANCLDDYEEGTWTPVLASAGGGTPTYAEHVGVYTKIGNRVFFEGDVQLSAFNTLAAGQLTITGLPFTSANNLLVTHVYFPFWANFVTSVGHFHGYVTASSTVITLLYIAAGGGTTNTNTLQKADIASNVVMYFSGSYSV